MDIKPVTRKSLVGALALWFVYVGLVVLLFRWASGEFAPFIVAAAVVAGVSVAIFSVVAWRPGVRRDEGWELTVYGARCQGRAHLDVPAEDVPGVVDRVCQGNEELGLRTLAVQGGAAATGPSFRSWGERLRFAIRPSSDGSSEVEATCRPLVPFVVSDWGRSERILRQFLRDLHEESLRPQAPSHTAGPSPTA
ncbi:hypothetical protein CWC38_03555 [Kocuria tytonicola]|uniref:hypothetical protein n=1 Tax=Kocuria tytonicola TaxID=2055946 RepID=UPI000EF8FF52|nr:hypothetical protein [Kocuria tytonicola]RLZ03858.1 hypothetical protein CWC38_03555 [Kocuria tytonicola]